MHGGASLAEDHGLAIHPGHHGDESIFPLMDDLAAFLTRVEWPLLTIVGIQVRGLLCHEFLLGHIRRLGEYTVDVNTCYKGEAPHLVSAELRVETSGGQYPEVWASQSSVFCVWGPDRCNT